jgi:hypothetical protein
MRIAQIAPLHKRVPATLYGGTERVVSFLTEELVRFLRDGQTREAGIWQDRKAERALPGPKPLKTTNACLPLGEFHLEVCGPETRCLLVQKLP